MKNILTFLSFIIITSFSVHSQGISFEENHDLNAALAKAKQRTNLFSSMLTPCGVVPAK